MRILADESNRMQNERLLPWWKQKGLLADLSRRLSGEGKSGREPLYLFDPLLGVRLQRPTSTATVAHWGPPVPVYQADTGLSSAEQNK